MNDARLVIVGNPEPMHVGAHLRAAAKEQGIPVEFCDTRAAFEGGWAVRQWNWRVRGHLPSRLAGFGAAVLKACERFKPTHLLATGIAPLGQKTIAELRGRGICALNYLTDDPVINAVVP